jgi:enamine deaminase RidA (YjgF/YER057c/UK114 family)
MPIKIGLKRFGSAPLVPVPRAVRAGDYVFTSSIYPVDESGRVVAIDVPRGEINPSLMEVQARHCLDTLKQVLNSSSYGTRISPRIRRREPRSKSVTPYHSTVCA